MPNIHTRALLTDDELTAYFLAVWYEVIDPICGGRSDYVLQEFVADHTAIDCPASQWRFQGRLGFGGKVHTASDMVCRVSCYTEDNTPERAQVILDANTMLEKIHSRFFAAKLIAFNAKT